MPGGLEHRLPACDRISSACCVAAARPRRRGSGRRGPRSRGAETPGAPALPCEQQRSDLQRGVVDVASPRSGRGSRAYSNGSLRACRRAGRSPCRRAILRRRRRAPRASRVGCSSAPVAEPLHEAHAAAPPGASARWVRSMSYRTRRNSMRARARAIDLEDARTPRRAVRRAAVRRSRVEQARSPAGRADLGLGMAGDRLHAIRRRSRERLSAGGCGRRGRAACRTRSKFAARHAGAGDVLPDRVARRAVDRGQLTVACAPPAAPRCRSARWRRRPRRSTRWRPWHRG